MTSKYKGVAWKKSEKKWESSVTVNGVKHPCGFYDDELSAVKARDLRIIAIGADYKKLQVIKPVKNETKNR